MRSQRLAHLPSCHRFFFHVHFMNHLFSDPIFVRAVPAPGVPAFAWLAPRCARWVDQLSVRKRLSAHTARLVCPPCGLLCPLRPSSAAQRGAAFQLVASQLPARRFLGLWDRGSGGLESTRARQGGAKGTLCLLCLPLRAAPDLCRGPLLCCFAQKNLLVARFSVLPSAPPCPQPARSQQTAAAAIAADASARNKYPRSVATAAASQHEILSISDSGGENEAAVGARDEEEDEDSGQS
jgi:hypothetical protein